MIKNIIFLFTTIFCLASFALDEISPTYSCGTLLIKFIGNTVLPKIEKLQSWNNALTTSSMMGFPKPFIPYEFVDKEVDNEYFKYINFIQKEYPRLDPSKRVLKVKEYVYKIGKAFKKGSPESSKICEKYMLGLLNICKDVKTAAEGKKCGIDYAKKNQGPITSMYSSTLFMKNLSNSLKADQLDKVVRNFIKEGNLEEYNKSLNTRLKVKINLGVSLVSFVSDMLSNNAVNIIQQTSFLGSDFIKTLDRMKGNSSKFLKFHILASKEETMIEFLRKIKIKDQSKIEEALKYSIKLKKVKLAKYLESIRQIKNSTEE